MTYLRRAIALTGAAVLAVTLAPGAAQADDRRGAGAAPVEDGPGLRTAYGERHTVSPDGTEVLSPFLAGHLYEGGATGLNKGVFKIHDPGCTPEDEGVLSSVLTFDDLGLFNSGAGVYVVCSGGEVTYEPVFIDYSEGQLPIELPVAARDRIRISVDATGDRQVVTMENLTQDWTATDDFVDFGNASVETGDAAITLDGADVPPPAFGRDPVKRVELDGIPLSESGSQKSQLVAADGTTILERATKHRAALDDQRFTLINKAEDAGPGGVELQARANLPVNDDGYNLPPGSSFNSISADISDADDVAFRVQLVPDDSGELRPGVWLGGGGTGEIVYTGDADQAIDNEASVNDDGDVAFTLSSANGNNLYLYDSATDTGGAISTAPVIPNSYSNPDLNDSGEIGFQANFGSGRAYAAYRDGAGVMYATDSGVTPGSPYSYFYTPSYNNAGQIAAKVATSDDQFTNVEIRLFAADGTSELLLANQATDPDSPYSRFDNSLALNDDGEIAVIATRAADNRRVVVRSDGTTTTEIAEVDPDGTLRSLEFFAPAINNSGEVAFRATDEVGQAVYVADGSSLVRVIGQGDVVETDLGTGQIGQHDTSPVFSGKPSINVDGDVAFVAGVHPEGDDQTEWGTGVFVAYDSAA